MLQVENMFFRQAGTSFSNFLKKNQKHKEHLPLVRYNNVTAENVPLPSLLDSVALMRRLAKWGTCCLSNMIWNGFVTCTLHHGKWLDAVDRISCLIGNQIFINLCTGVIYFHIYFMHLRFAQNQGLTYGSLYLFASCDQAGAWCNVFVSPAGVRLAPQIVQRRIRQLLSAAILLLERHEQKRFQEQDALASCVHAYYLDTLQCDNDQQPNADSCIMVVAPVTWLPASESG